MKKFDKFLDQTLEAGQIQIIDYDISKRNKKRTSSSKDEENSFYSKLKKCYKILKEDKEKLNSFIKQFEDGEYQHIFSFMKDFINAVNLILDDKDKIDDISKDEAIELYERIIDRDIKSKEIRQLFKILFSKYEYLKDLEQQQEQNDQSQEEETEEEEQKKEESYDEEQSKTQGEQEKKDYMKSSIGDFNLNDVFESRYREIMSEHIINESVFDKIADYINSKKQKEPESDKALINILTIYADNSYDVYGDDLYSKAVGSTPAEFIKSYFENLKPRISKFYLGMKGGKQTQKELDKSQSFIKLIDSLTEKTKDEKTIWYIRLFKPWKKYLDGKGINDKSEGKKLVEIINNECGGSIKLSDKTKLEDIKSDIIENIKNFYKKADSAIKTAAEDKEKFQKLNKDNNGQLVYYFKWFLTFLQRLDRVTDSTFEAVYKNILRVDSELGNLLEKRDNDLQEQGEEQNSKDANKNFNYIIQEYFKAFVDKRLSVLTDSFYNDLTKKYLKFKKAKRVISRTRFYKNFIRYVIQGVCKQDINRIQQLLKKTKINKKWLEEKYIKYFIQVMLSNETIKKVITLSEFSTFFDDYIASTDNEINEYKKP